MNFNNYEFAIKIGINYAVQLAARTGGELTPDHLLAGLCKYRNRVQMLLAEYGITLYKIESGLRTRFSPTGLATVTPETEAILVKANELAKEIPDSFIHILTSENKITHCILLY